MPQPSANKLDLGAEHGTSWSSYALMFLAVWLASGPFTLGYHTDPMAYSDWVSAVVVLLLAIRSARSPCRWAQWAGAAVGMWLLFSPLAFWTTSAAAYDAATLIGTLIIIFSVVLPRTSVEGIPSGADVPPGWSYNPSAWIQRAPIVGMAFIGFFISRYLAAFQLGHIVTVWDPFFRDGTGKILQSDVSRAFPVSDAGLGAVSYLIEAITGLVGGTRRWRTMPWMVIFFGILVVPLGAVSIVLVILQPIAVGAWCTLCLVTALAMLVMISPAADEVVATGQFLAQSLRAGKPFWRTFRNGDALGAITETRSASQSELSHHRWTGALFGLDGITWSLVASAVLGVWLIVSPTLFDTTGTAAANGYLIGPLVVTISVIALGEIARTVRWINVLFGLWLLLAPWVLAGSAAPSKWSDMAVGIALILLSIPRGQIQERFGGFNRYIV